MWHKRLLQASAEKKPFFLLEKAVLSLGKSRSFYWKKPFFLWEKAVLSPRESVHYANNSKLWVQNTDESFFFV